MSEEESKSADPGFQFGTLGRHSFIYGIGMVASKAVSILMLPIYTRLLTPGDYGVLALITMTFEVVTIFAGSRIAVGIFHFYHKGESDREKRGVVSTAFLLLAVMYSAAAAATIYWASPIALVVFGEGEIYAELIRLAATSMVFEGLLLVPTALFQLQDRSKLFVLVSLVRLALQVASNLIFLIPFQLGVAGVMWGAVVTHGVMGTALSVWLIGSVGARFDLTAAKAFLRFGVPLMVMQVATFIVTFGDRYFLNQAGDTAQVGLYSLAYQFGFLVMTLSYIPFQQVWDPQRFALAKRPDRDEIYARVLIYVSILVVTAALGIALFAGDVLRVIASPEFHSAAVFVPVLAAAYVVQSWSYFLNLGIYITERTEYFTLANWISAVVAVIGYVLLIPRWLAWGATITTLVALIVRCWLSHVFSQRLWRVEYRWGPVARLSVLGLVVGAASALTPSFWLPASMLYHGALFVIYAGLLWRLPILTPWERGEILRRLAALRGASAAPA